MLRTVAYGPEGIPGVGLAATQSPPNVFPLSQNEAALEAWLNAQIGAGGGAGNALRAAAAGPIDSMTRALDRRIMTAAFGSREALTALLAAFDRAKDLIYIETPALDNVVIESGGENVQLWQRLITRMNSRRGLRVVVCVPTLCCPARRSVCTKFGTSAYWLPWVRCAPPRRIVWRCRRALEPGGQSASRALPWWSMTRSR